jgi:hypothetical protein
MLDPLLSSWVEERYYGSSLRVDAVGLITLGVVAQAASQPQVVFSIAAAPGARSQVIDFQLAKHILLLALAIATTISRLLTYPPLDVLWNAR